MGGPIGPTLAFARRLTALRRPVWAALRDRVPTRWRSRRARCGARRGCMRTEHRRGVFLLGMTVALSGCLKSVEYVQPKVPLNPEWTQQVAAREYEAEWWRQFDDATLDQLIEPARRQNLPLQIGRVCGSTRPGRSWPSRSGGSTRRSRRPSPTPPPSA